MNVIEVMFVFGTEIDEVLAVQVERFGVVSAFERFTGWIALDSRLDYRDRPVS